MSRRQTVNPAIRAQVIATWGNDCWLGLPGCTGIGEEDDHIVPWSHGGRDTVMNLRRACKHCNAMRQDRVLSGYGARLHMIICPPGSCDREAQDWITSHAADADPVVSYSRLAQAMRIDGSSMDQRRAAAMAWSAAYRQFAKSADPVDVWMIRTIPQSRRHPRMIDEWIALDYDITVIDPGFEEEWHRATTDLSRRLVRQWYALHLTQRLVDGRQALRRARLASLGLRRQPAELASRPVW